jgi:hypothetical protein
MPFFDVMSEVQKDWEDVSAGRDIYMYKKSGHKNFVGNLTSKLVYTVRGKKKCSKPL